MKTDKPRDLKIWHITNMPSEAGTQFISKIAHDQAVKQLEQRLNEAEKVIAFYAEPEVWSRDDTMLFDRINPSDCADYPHITRDVRETGGKLARQYMEKMK